MSTTLTAARTVAPPHRPRTVRIAHWSATHRAAAVVLWITFVAVAFLAGSAGGTRQPSAHQLGTGQSGRAADMMRAAGFDPPATEQVLVEGSSALADQVADALRRVTGVASVAAPVLSADGSARLVEVTLAGDPDTAADRVQPVLDATARLAAQHPGARISETGHASVDAGINAELGRDFGTAARYSLPLTLLILLIAFGALLAAGLPLVLALTSVMGAIGLSALVSHLLPATPTINEVILLIGMAVGVDYSLFFVRRERDERARGRDRLTAIEAAAATSGHAVLVSGAAVMVSMAGLYLTRDVSFASLATGSVIVVGVAMLGSLTVLPALLATFGRAVDRPRVPVLWRLTNRTGHQGRIWSALLRPALRRPGVTALVTLTALLALAAPALRLTLRSSTIDDLPRTIPAVAAYDRLVAHFPDETLSHQVVVRAPAAESGEVTAALRGLARRAAADPRFGAQKAVLQASPDGTVHVLEVTTPAAPRSARARATVSELRSDLVPSALRGIAGAEFAVGGSLASDVDNDRQMAAELPWVIGFVLVLTLVVMLVAFRAVVVAVTAIAVNLLSAGAAFGVLVLVCQGSWASLLLGGHVGRGIVSWIPMFLFVVLFGLSMDYHVFVVSRIREGVAAGLPTAEAVRLGITRSAGVVTSAAAVMIGVFGVFATLSMVEFQQLGIGLATAILLDALAIRIVLLPALMTLFGRANWWPGRPARVGARRDARG